MDTARSVSGVLQTVGGQYCAVTIMVNGHRQSVGALKGEIDSLVAVLDSIKSIKLDDTPAAAATKSALPGKNGNSGQQAAMPAIVGGKSQAVTPIAPANKTSVPTPQQNGQLPSSMPATANQSAEKTATTLVELSAITPAPHIVRHKRHHSQH
jgi:hypothetical protein